MARQSTVGTQWLKDEMAKHKRGAVTVRVIGGKWKGRKLRVAANTELRPTLGRSRETLFNWLRGELHNSRCLDLFAGSGVLGLEALSQGAANVTWVESNHTTFRSLKENLATLHVPSEHQVHHADAVNVLNKASAQVGWDIVFLDPPFGQPQLLTQAMHLICTKQLARKYIYVEAASSQATAQLADEFGCVVHRTTRAGDTCASLLLPPDYPA